MEQSPLQKLMEARTRDQIAQGLTAYSSDDKFYSVLLGEGNQEHFVEFRLNSGLRTCFPYTDLQWFNFDPEAGCIDLEFGGFLITIKGRGLDGRLFQGLRQKRLVWVREPDSEMQDHADNEVFIEEITITPPGGFAGDDT